MRVRMWMALCFCLSVGQTFAQPTDVHVHSKVKTKQVYGYVENATLVDAENTLKLKAKLDTGAKTSSLYAKKMRYLIIDNKPYLSFVVPTKSGDIPFTVPYVGEVSIKARSGEVAGVRIKNPFIKRPVVKMNIQLGSRMTEVRVNLANRKRFSYPLLLGREAIVALDGLVDAGKKYTVS